VETLQPNKTYMVSYKTNQPVFVSYYTEQWNAHPLKEGNNFKIATRFIKDGKTVEQLKAGEEYQLAVHVNVERAASYVMIEVPLPAGCLPADQYTKETNETHRESFMDKTNIYLTHVSAGSYTYYVPVKASYAGLYTLNPAKVSLMYFPALYGQEGLKKISIVER
ncbi:MAG: large extracellular alpha-helical protein, partial [Cytophagaceae bacterium]|nr:large extracellular alpha-helical protein [Cytophagaceae bacterium]